MLNQFIFQDCFVFENTGSHLVLARTPGLLPIDRADDMIVGKSLSAFLRMLGTERIFCIQGRCGPMAVLCPAERKTVSIAILLAPTPSAKTELNTDIPTDPHIPYRFRRSVLESAKAISALFFEPINSHAVSEDDPLGDVRLANKLSFFFKQFNIRCEVHMQPREVLPVFGNNESGIMFFLAALCIKLAQIEARKMVYLQPTPTCDGFLLDLTIPALSREQTELLRTYTATLLGSRLDFPFAFGTDENLIKIRYYPVKKDESLFGLKRSGAGDIETITI